MRGRTTISNLDSTVEIVRVARGTAVKNLQLLFVCPERRALPRRTGIRPRATVAALSPNDLFATNPRREPSRSPSVSSIQSQKDRWLRCQRASSRRDSRVRGQQEDAELGLRYDRGLVSALAIDGDGKAKLPEHSLSVSRPFEADEFRASSPDRHGWIRMGVDLIFTMVSTTYRHTIAGM